jgi:hypothetical protein
LQKRKKGLTRVLRTYEVLFWRGLGHEQEDDSGVSFCEDVAFSFFVSFSDDEWRYAATSCMHLATTSIFSLFFRVSLVEERSTSLVKPPPVWSSEHYLRRRVLNSC